MTTAKTKALFIEPMLLASLSRNIEIDLKEMIKDTVIPAPLTPKNFIIL